MKTYKILLVLFIASGVVFFSCRHEVIPEPPPSGGGGTGGGGSGTGKVCFESDVLPIFQSTCAKAGCHDKASAKEGYVLDTYANIIKKGLVPGKATSSELYKVLFKTGNDRMPEPPNPELTVAQKNIIGTWINEGAENTVNCGSSCDTTKFTFAANVNPILQNNCTGCHNASNAQGGVNLVGYSAVKVYADNGKLYGSIAHLSGYKPMPQGAAKLSDCNIRVVQKWIQAGALNN